MKLRMAMNKLKQAFGLQITDDELIALLRRDMDEADPIHDWYGPEHELESDLYEIPNAEDLDFYAEVIESEGDRQSKYERLAKLGLAEFQEQGSYEGNQALGRLEKGLKEHLTQQGLDEFQVKLISERLLDTV